MLASISPWGLLKHAQRVVQSRSVEQSRTCHCLPARVCTFLSARLCDHVMPHSVFQASTLSAASGSMHARRRMPPSAS